MSAERPTLAVWKFSSCDGCQLSLLACEDELLAMAGAVEIAYFPEATSAELADPLAWIGRTRVRLLPPAA